MHLDCFYGLKHPNDSNAYLDDCKALETECVSDGYMDFVDEFCISKGYKHHLSYQLEPLNNGKYSKVNSSMEICDSNINSCNGLQTICCGICFRMV